MKPRYAIKQSCYGWLWTEKEDAFITKNAGVRSRKEIATFLRRGISSTQQRARVLGVKLATVYQRNLNEVIGKTFGHLKPFKKGPSYSISGNARVWCHDDSFPSAPDRLAFVTNLRLGLTKGIKRTKGLGFINASGYHSIGIKTGKRTYGRIFTHRLAMEKYLGRPLTKTESVHHRGSRTDNKIEMLVLKNKAHGPGQSIYDQIKWLRSLGVSIGPVPAKLRKIWKD